MWNPAEANRGMFDGGGRFARISSMKARWGGQDPKGGATSKKKWSRTNAGERPELLRGRFSALPVPA